MGPSPDSCNQLPACLLMAWMADKVELPIGIAFQRRDGLPVNRQSSARKTVRRSRESALELVLALMSATAPLEAALSSTA